MAGAGEQRTAGADGDGEVDADARALASTLRLRILRLCLDESLTNREIARRLEKNPATVLHHVRTLVDRGFLVAEPVRRGARGSREVPYRATGKSWRTPPRPGQARLLVDTFLEELALVPDLDSVVMARLGLRLRPDEHAELVGRIDALLQEYAARPSSSDGEPYSMFVAVHEDVSRRRAPEARPQAGVSAPRG
ncbi:winged helix-turn-helix domain-containing protein [Cellulomonas sp. HZM]|uniref:winged helix-turn-helix domain-containing protein n=1 Tax=Cellulomonas sp. HZM TaxID=1454010 RepID=UPI000492F9BC|nr:winged helix-turn-helix domain-containing protein [Cellulomonas sp. HZM]